MLSISCDKLALFCQENGHGLTLQDRENGESWLMDEQTLVFGGVDNAGGRQTQLKPMSLQQASLANPKTIQITLLAGETAITIDYTLEHDFLEIRLPAIHSLDIGILSLPGSFQPASGKPKYLLPIMQGMMWDGRGEACEHRYWEAGHGGFSMAMYGVLGKNGGLLFAAETADDCLWWVGKDQNGRTWATNLQVDSLGTMRYERIMRLYPVPANITSLAKRYRARVMERGRFISWEEKIAERPALKRLFGTIMCFIGYCQDDIDYAHESRKLKAYGFDKALLYSVRFNTYSKDFLMGGYPPINLDRDVIREIKDLGFDVAPWSWINEGLDDGTEDMRLRYRRNRKGEMAKNWQIDEQRWYACCTTMMEEFLLKQNAGEFSDMTWDHFDVITCATNNECHALDHPNHLGRPLSKSEDREWIRKLLLAGQKDNKPVSSENFNDAYSLEYDLGSVKAWPQYGPWVYWPVPLTMLVFHDSMMHTWWEPHNYNSHFFDRNVGPYQYGGGKTRLMASMDALYGCPPDVFPFGAMYGWTGNGHETFLYRFRLEDPETQFALQQALPVARLHEKTGMQEMIDFQFLSDDGTLQKTTFADGTTVYANLGQSVGRGLETIGGLQAESWKSLRKE